MLLRNPALNAFVLYLTGCSPAMLTTMINTTSTPLTLQIHHQEQNDPRFATNVIEVPAYASTPGPSLWNTTVEALGVDGSVLFHQEHICPDVVTSDYACQEKIGLFGLRTETRFAIENDGIYRIPVKYWDSVYSHLNEIRKQP